MTVYGAGSLTLSANNAYNGGTTVTGGTLVAANAGASLGTGTTSVTGSGILAGTGATGGPVTLAGGGTVTGGTGATATSALGHLTSGQQTWNGGTYAVKLDSTQSTADSTLTGQSGVQALAGGAFATDELIVSSLATTSATPALTISPVIVTNGTGSIGTSSFTAGQAYSFVIAHDQNTAGTYNATTFDGLLLNTQIALTPSAVASGFSLADQADTSGGEDLLLDYAPAAAPEPTSLLLAGVAAAPLALGRRRRKAAVV